MLLQFWSIFHTIDASCKQKIYLYQSLCEKCPNKTFFLVCFFLYSDLIQKNTDQKNIRIWILFTQCNTMRCINKILFKIKVTSKYKERKCECSSDFKSKWIFALIFSSEQRHQFWTLFTQCSTIRCINKILFKINVTSKRKERKCEC